MSGPDVPGEANLVLAGFMGTGKSTVGRLLAHRLGRPFVDTDQLVEAEARMEIREIFAQHGEAAFRAYERDVCLRASEAGGQVIAIGGGALLDLANREAMEGSGIMVLLTCEPHALAGRLRESALRGERPLLGEDPDGVIARLLKEREPVYSAVRLQVDTTHLTPAQVTERVLALYRGATRSFVQAGLGR